MASPATQTDERATIKISATRPIQCGASPLTTRRDTRRFGAHALHLLESGAQFDVVITDYAMPAMTGLDLATKIKHIKPEMPVIIAAGYAELPPQVTLGFPRLNKPYTQEQLAQALAVSGKKVRS